MADDKPKKPHPGTKNLRVPTSEQAREYGRRGGQASAAAAKRRKSLRELANALLQSEVLDKSERKILEEMGLEPTNGAAMLHAMFSKAKSGSERAAEFVRDTSGQAPAQVQHIISGDALQADEVGRLSDDDLKRVISEAEEG